MTDQKAPTNTDFLFVNKDAKNIHRKGHIAEVNAHVHADARLKKKNKRALPKPPADQATTGIYSWRLGKFPNPPDVGSSTVAVTSAPEGEHSAPPEQLSSLSPALSVISLCNSPSTASDSAGPSTPGENPPPVTLRSANKRSQERLSEKLLQRRLKHEHEAFAVTKGPDPESIGTAICAYVGSALDPFCALPGETTSTERTLAHYYLSYMGSLVYGTKLDAAFCPVRDVTFANLQKSSLVLQWCVIGSESHLARLRGLPEPPSLLRRRAEVYREMNRNLSDPVLRRSEGIFASISGAIINDSRDAGPKVASLHLRGLETLLESRGGLESFYRENPSTYSVFFFVWVHHACCGGGVAELPPLQKYIVEFIQTLRDMQIWNRKLRNDLKRLIVHRLWQSGAPATAAPISFKTSRRNQDNILEAYASSRASTFSTSSILRPLLEPDFPCRNAVDATCHFSNIYTTNLTLWTFREDHVAGANFLSKIIKHMNDNGSRDPITGITSLTLAALVWMLRKARVEVDNNGEESQKREVWVSWKIVNSLKVMALLDGKTRQMLITKLSSWLTNIDLERQWEFSDDDFRAIEIEVLKNWEADPG